MLFDNRIGKQVEIGRRPPGAYRLRVRPRLTRLGAQHVLGFAVGMIDETAAMLWAPLVQGLFEGVEDETGMHRMAGPPADDPPDVGIDEQGNVDEACPDRDAGEIG